MSEFKFKAQDFDKAFNAASGSFSLPDVAKLANKLLAEWLSTGVKVHGARHNDMWCMSEIIVDGTHLESQTHEAILVNIKPIERECTEHEPVTLTEEYVIASTITPGKIGWSFFEHDNWKCQKCGKRLKATWSVVDE